MKLSAFYRGIGCRAKNFLDDISNRLIMHTNFCIIIKAAVYCKQCQYETTIYTGNNNKLLLLCGYLPGSGSLPTSRLYQPASSSSSSSSSLTSLKPGASSSVERKKNYSSSFTASKGNKLEIELSSWRACRGKNKAAKGRQTFCIIAIIWSLHLLFFSLTFYAACSAYNNKNSRFLSISKSVHPQVLLERVTWTSRFSVNDLYTLWLLAEWLVVREKSLNRTWILTSEYCDGLSLSPLLQCEHHLHWNFFNLQFKHIDLFCLCSLHYILHV